MAGKPKSVRKNPVKRGKAPTLDPELIAEALDYRTQGYPIPDVATQMNKTILEVEELINAGLSLDYVEPPHFATRLELRRLQLAQQSVIANAAQGDKEAIELMMRLEEKVARVKLLLVPSLKDLFGDPALLRQANLTSAVRKQTGRPPYTPNLNDARKVQTLAMVNTPLRIIAKMVGIGFDTLIKYYEETIETARHNMVAVAGGTVVEAMHKGDAAIAFRVLERIGPPVWKPPQNPTSLGGGAERGKVDPAAATTKHEIEIVGGLPKGSTPENPGGTEHSDIPPEESHG